jgi:hypothetical protein
MAPFQKIIFRREELGDTRLQPSLFLKMFAEDPDGWFGDLLIAASALALAAFIASIAQWPLFGARMAIVTLLPGLGYTVFSEWLNTEAMPVLPPLGTGLTPFLQWPIVPAMALGYAARKFSDRCRLE